jgi:hypothetical protein
MQLEVFIDPGLGEESWRILDAASDLRYFALSDIAAHSDLPESAVAAYVAAHGDLIEALAVPRDLTGPGGGRRTHRLRPEQSGLVAAWLARQAAVRDRLTQVDAMPEAPSLLTTLEARIARLSGIPRQDTLFGDEVELAGRHLLGAWTSFCDRRDMGAPLEAAEEARLRRAKAELGRLRESGHPIPSLAPFAGRANAMRLEIPSRLGDWTEIAAPRGTRNADLLAVVSAIQPQGLIETILMPPPDADTVLRPAAWLTVLAGAMQKAVRTQVATELAHRIGNLDPAHEPYRLAALAVAAAMIDAEPATEPLFEAVMRARRSAPFAAQPLSLCCAALARLARPHTGATSPQRAAAVLACRYLVNDAGRLTEGDLMTLIPAALWGDNVATGSLLTRMARAVAAVRNDAQAHRLTGAAMRNLAMTLQARAFGPLDEQIGSLLADPHGRALIEALGHPEYDAVVFHDADQGNPYRVGVGRRVAAALGLPPTALRGVILQIAEDDAAIIHLDRIAAQARAWRIRLHVERLGRPLTDVQAST